MSFEMSIELRTMCSVLEVKCWPHDDWREDSCEVIGSIDGKHTGWNLKVHDCAKIVAIQLVTVQLSQDTLSDFDGVNDKSVIDSLSVIAVRFGSNQKSIYLVKWQSL